MAINLKLIILDRDGVINEDSDDYIKSPEEWQPIAGSLEAIARLTQWNWRVVVVTNQSGIGRKLFSMATLNQIHDKMLKAVSAAGGRIDALFFCPHTDEDRCACRKPKAGLLTEVAARYGVDLSKTPAIGDNLRDLQAARSAGAQPILVLTGKGKKTQADPVFTATFAQDVAVYANLAEAVAQIIKTQQ